jgi:penicillin-binding protein 2
MDLDLQRVAEEAFASADPEKPDYMGALIALDPRNGDVLALVSKPSFDPNAFAGGIDSAAWTALQTDPWKPLNNRAISGLYPPGSTYKVIVAAAGLGEDLVDPEETVFCPGHYRLGRRVYRCWKRGGHGDVNLRESLKQSCDVYYYQLGIALGIDTIAKYANAFGLGRKTGIDLQGEEAGLIPTMEWKERARKEKWIKGETVSAAIGQGYNLVSPLQLAVMYSAIANGGTLYVPRLIRRYETWEGRLVAEVPVKESGQVGLSKELIDKVREGLEAVVMEPHGTGGRARVKGVRVAGKSGTTQVVSLDRVKDMEEDEIPIRWRDHAIFASFAPVEDPQIVVAVLVEHAGGGGGRVAAPIAQRVLAAYFEKYPHESLVDGSEVVASLTTGQEGSRHDD